MSMGGILSPMPHPTFVCAHDPLHPEAVGTVVSEPRKQLKLDAGGAVHLPIEAGCLKLFPLGGFVRRNWGRDGQRFDLNRAEGGSPVALQVRTGDSRLYWAAEVTTSPMLGARPYASGKLQLVLNRSAVGVLSPGFSQVTQPPPFEIPAGKSLLLRGSVQINTLLDGLVGLQLWGVCNAVAVRWIAVSQAGAGE